jgi:hypothetical protein
VIGSLDLVHLNVPTRRSPGRQCIKVDEVVSTSGDGVHGAGEVCPHREVHHPNRRRNQDDAGD